MKWLELKIDAAPAGLEPVSALLEDLGITGLVIDDEGDFQDFLEHNHAYWDYVDDQLMQEKKGLCRITFYLEDSPDGYNTLAQVRMALSRVKQEHPEYGRLLLTMENMEDADWENNWKQFYKPMEIGDRLTVIPEWESTGVPEDRVEAEAARWVAKPGTSEHQTGLALDIVAAGYQILDEEQEDTAEQKWLMENSWKYGFILRYPSEKSDITGIGYEPWHYRYVGKAAAADIYRTGVCLEEYLSQEGPEAELAPAQTIRQAAPASGSMETAPQGAAAI